LTSVAVPTGRDTGRLRLSTGAALALIVMGAVVAAMVSGNLAFLQDATSWQLGFSVVPQAPSDPYWKTMGIAVLNTVVLAGVAITVATVAGAAIAFVAIAGNPAWSQVASGYVQLFRNMPLLLQALFWFAVISHLSGPRQALRFAGVVVSNRGVSTPFFTPAALAAMGAAIVGAVAMLWLLRKTRPFQRGRAPIVLGSAALAAGATWKGFFPGEAIWSAPELRGFNFTGGVHLPTELISILVALSMFGSAYVAEIVRGGFETVPKGVIEAARALALPAWAVEAKVRVPLALRAIILPLGSQYTTLIKATSIGLAIGFTDLFAVTLMSINQSGHTISLLCVMTACFVLLNQAVVSAANALNRAFQVPGTAGR
jgi:ABC-type amino acid transport system permease subunit